MKRCASVLFLALISLALFGQGTKTIEIPAHHKTPPKKTDTLPPILPREQLWGPSFQYPVQVHAYELAAKIPDVLYQLPCYCFCDRSVGHTSLRSCYESTHAAHCAACMKEMYYAYLQTKEHKTPAQIRAEIIKGAWEQIDLSTAADIN